MRRVLLFVVASALLSAGLYLLYLQFVSGNALGKVTMVGFTMALLGGYLLWADFIAPSREGERK